MSLTLYNSVFWGIEKQTISSGGNIGSPTLLSAASLGSTRVRLTFNRNMRQELSQGLPHREGTLALSSYRITRVVGGALLPIVRVVRVDATHVDLITEDQTGGLYNATALAGGAMDEAGNVISEQTVVFTGTAPSGYPVTSSLHLFSSGYPGMQEDEASDPMPDLDPPVLQNQNPAPNDTGVDPDTLIYLEVDDLDEGIDLSSLKVWVQGSLAYRGDTGVFLAPFNGPSSSISLVGSVYQVTLDRSSPFLEWETVSVQVYVRDLAGIPNELDESYTFRTWDVTAPTTTPYSPTGAGQDKQVLITCSLRDVGGSGVVQSTINATVQGFAAIVNGVFQPGFQGVSSAITANGFNGFDVVIDRQADHPSSAAINVFITAQDVAGNPGSRSWSFTVTDYAGPLVNPTDPSIGETDVPIDQDITFEISDDSGVDLTTIIVEVNPGTGFETAFVYADTPQFKTGWAGPNSLVSTALGVTTIVIDKETDLTLGTTVQVRVTALDIYGNPARLS